MDSRLKLKEVILFFKTIINTHNDGLVSKQDKNNCYKTIVKDILMILYNGITTPFIYPIWYLFRKQISDKIYQGTTWQEILKLMDSNQPLMVKDALERNGKFLYWLWTYGDLEDPTGDGGMPESFGANTFWNRFKYSAIRNPRFNYAYLNFRTGLILSEKIVIDTRNFNIMHKSVGLGDSPDGIYFKWMVDTSNKWYFIYENNNSDNLFYFGYVDLLNLTINNNGGRFELSYRQTDSTYTK